MNAEKELLLALLVEKYTTKTQPVQREAKPSETKARRRSRGKIHRWTHADKQLLMQMRNQGRSFLAIADVMGLRTSQVENMFYTLTEREKAVR